MATVMQFGHSNSFSTVVISGSVDRKRFPNLPGSRQIAQRARFTGRDLRRRI
jgi:hypothetical protein